MALNSLYRGYLADFKLTASRLILLGPVPIQILALDLTPCPRFCAFPWGGRVSQYFRDKGKCLSSPKNAPSLPSQLWTRLAGKGVSHDALRAQPTAIFWSKMATTGGNDNYKCKYIFANTSVKKFETCWNMLVRCICNGLLSYSFENRYLTTFVNMPSASQESAHDRGCVSRCIQADVSCLSRLQIFLITRRNEYRETWVTRSDSEAKTRKSYRNAVDTYRVVAYHIEHWKQMSCSHDNCLFRDSREDLWPHPL